MMTYTLTKESKEKSNKSQSHIVTLTKNALLKKIGRRNNINK